jgi:phage terminase large subunit
MHEAGEDWREAYEPDDLIALNSKMPELGKVLQELAQPTYKQSKAGKMMVDKTPDGLRSPNFADAIMIRFAPRARRASYDLSAWAS